MPGLTAGQRRIAESIISIFENNTPVLRYDYIEALGDGRGYTAGRAGFTTADGDLLRVVERYHAAPLLPFLPLLRDLASHHRDTVTRLRARGFARAWQHAAKDPRFRAVQDSVVDELYYLPSIKTANTLGIRTALGILILYDTAIQHGTGDDPDSLQAIIRSTNRLVGGSPAGGTIPEPVWLSQFLRCRRAILAHSHDAKSRAVWQESVGRVDTLKGLLRGNHWDLSPPITINPYGHPFRVI